MGYFMTPTGKRVTHTVQELRGSRRIHGIHKDEDEDFTVVHDDNGTEIDWDSARQEVCDGYPMYRDEDGDEWLEYQLSYHEGA